jgi:hypothetical protein
MGLLITIGFPGYFKLHIYHEISAAVGGDNKNYRSGFKSFNRVQGPPLKGSGIKRRTEAVNRPDLKNRDKHPYREYFEDWTSQFNTEIETEGRF